MKKNVSELSWTKMGGVARNFIGSGHGEGGEDYGPVPPPLAMPMRSAVTELVVNVPIHNYTLVLKKYKEV